MKLTPLANEWDDTTNIQGRRFNWLRRDQQLRATVHAL
jgi:hypothetical protein